MDESTSGDRERQHRSAEVNTGQKQGATCLKMANYAASNEACDLSRIPRRKLSVFYRSFDVIAQIDQGKERGALDFRRTSSSPSVRIDGIQEDNDPNDKDEGDRETGLHKRELVTYRSLIESGKFLTSSSPDRLSEKPSSNKGQASNKVGSLSPKAVELSQVREDTIVDNYSTITSEASIGKRYKLNNNGNYSELKVADENVAINSHQTDSTTDPTNTVPSFAEEKIGNNSTNGTIDLHRANSVNATRSICPFNDLVKIKDSEYPRTFVNASSAGRLGKYTSVDAEMSSHEDSSIGSDSEDDSIERNMHAALCSRDEGKMERRRSKSDSPLSQPLSLFCSITEPSRKLSREIDEHEEAEDPEEFRSKREDRQRFFATKRSLSEGDCERYHRAKCHCKYTKEEESFDERTQFLAFPSFNDIKLQIIGLSCSKDIDNVYRENLPEKELERKYIAFSIGLGSDRITLHRRMVLSLRQRDQSERNFMNEIQRMQEDIKDLCSLCTDQESIDKVEKVRHRLDMIARSAHRISCAAETLGAVYQEHRLSRAIFIGDKYLQLLRSRCENLATDIEEIKEILLKNNIMIEETSGEIGDDLPKIRYRNGLPCNNRTMMARRRASIATITRPLNSQDVLKEAPRQRNSVSGRVTLRRPSLCFETQKWENEKLNRTDANSVIELRDIFEHTELRRNSIEENNNLLRNDQNNSVYNVNCDITNNVKDRDRLITKQNSFLELNVAKTVEKQLKSCIRTHNVEPLRITRNIETWRPILWFTFIFFLGFYAKQIISTFVR